MTSRQARKLRREQERKAKKAAYKVGLQAAAAPVTPAVPCNPELLDEFSPEFLAYADSMRERVERRVATLKQTAPSSPHPRSSSGFVSQDFEGETESAGFVSQEQGAKPNTSTRRRSEINRANAAHSTGPRSSDGKLASSRNSLKHGLASGVLIIPGEDPTEFESLLEALLAEHQPANATEQMLIHEIAQSWWLTQRAIRLQNECFTDAGVDDERTRCGTPGPFRPGSPLVRVDEKRLSLFLRHQTTHERAFQKALGTLTRLQKDRRKSASKRPNGFVSQKHALAAPSRGFVSQTRPETDRETASISQNTPPERLADAA